MKLRVLTVPLQSFKGSLGLCQQNGGGAIHRPLWLRASHGILPFRAPVVPGYPAFTSLIYQT